jgi:hypothetical protein
LHGTVVVAVTAVRVVQVAVDEVVDVVSMGHGFVTTARAVGMGNVVGATGV